MHQSLKIILFYNNFTCFVRSFCPSSRALCLLANKQQYLFDICLLQYVLSWNPDDGQKNRPKRVELFQK